MSNYIPDVERQTVLIYLWKAEQGYPVNTKHLYNILYNKMLYKCFVFTGYIYMLNRTDFFSAINITPSLNIFPSYEACGSN